MDVRTYVQTLPADLRNLLTHQSELMISSEQAYRGTCELVVFCLCTSLSHVDSACFYNHAIMLWLWNVKGASCRRSIWIDDEVKYMVEASEVKKVPAIVFGTWELDKWIPGI